MQIYVQFTSNLEKLMEDTNVAVVIKHLNRKQLTDSVSVSGMAPIAPLPQLAPEKRRSDDIYQGLLQFISA